MSIWRSSGRRAAWLAGILVVLAMAAHAGNLNFLRKSPISYFNDEDMRLLQDAVAQVLADANNYAKKNWSNPATGSSGEVEGRGGFKTSDGVKCRRLRVSNHARGIDGQATYTLCEDSERSWVINQTAKPG